MLGNIIYSEGVLFLLKFIRKYNISVITNDKMHVHCYRKKTWKQFVDFLKRVIENRYSRNIQNIFLVLDNLSVHKSKKVKEEIAKYCQRIKLIFLSIRSPELNLIEDGYDGYKGRRQITILQISCIIRINSFMTAISSMNCHFIAFL